ncbi:glycosyltransferase family 4 protein [Azospirillum brasilense]|uniref:Glycosyltransferase n=1 Tax=Azospirillum brasilense TaxID=192 RepID=A0A6L3AUC4_AZOBR|nr:glycosyltransferase [Azospirillum brasilense]KAA0679867.1 glycosyltransferase [Azospirillum brasilense]
MSEPFAGESANAGKSILLVAFAFEPDSGSESANGWNWGEGLKRSGCRVKVVTQGRLRPKILGKIARGETAFEPDDFVFIDRPDTMAHHDSKTRFQLSYIAWQWRCRAVVKELVRRQPFDVIHNVTIGGIRFPAFCGGLAPLSVIGPVGGGERAPWPLIRPLGWRAIATELVRNAAIAMTRIDPFLRLTYRRYNMIYVKTHESRHVLPAGDRHKARQHFGCSLLPDRFAPPKAEMKAETGGDSGAPLKLLFSGRFLYWKGGYYALTALARALEKGARARLQMIGSGPQSEEWKNLADRLGIAEHVDFIEWLSQPDYLATLRSADALLFPSLHDSAANVIMEALANAQPVICLDLGGSGIMIDSSCGFAVPCRGRAAAEVIDGLADAIVTLDRDRPRLRAMSRAAHARAQDFASCRITPDIYAPATA